ncbi:hypothetical protein HMI54_008510 [Coelomomyces lativittatus]|nr:hypothetical protein HMI56_006952 [Coelomomyces lativittatus]KAJ1516701.1 hypothetical protein HMI54_008510 [Coelomomyces lativittatus]KAJ1517462.1 hypothetical protein HMI55_006996 [Coelomomyces lativittatus]
MEFGKNPTQMGQPFDSWNNQTTLVNPFNHNNSRQEKDPLQSEMEERMELYSQTTVKKFDLSLAESFAQTFSNFDEPTTTTQLGSLEEVSSTTLFDAYTQLCLTRSIAGDCSEDSRKMLISEAQTWDLLSRLSKLRSQTINSTPSASASWKSASKTNDEIISECKTVKSWLEHWFAKKYQEKYQNNKVNKNQGSSIPSSPPFSPSSPLLKTMSSPLQQKIPISSTSTKPSLGSKPSSSVSLNASSSEEFFKHVFMILKTGNLDLVYVHLAPETQTDPYVVRFLNGLHFQTSYLNPSTTSTMVSATYLTPPPTHLHVFQQSCQYHASQLPSHALYERACYSYVCGNISGLLPVCHDVHTLLFMYIHCILVNRMDMYFHDPCWGGVPLSATSTLESHSSCTLSSHLTQLPGASMFSTSSSATSLEDPLFPSSSTTFQEVIESIKHHAMPSVKSEVHQFYIALQFAILTHQVDPFFKSRLQTPSFEDFSFHHVRCGVHLGLLPMSMTSWRWMSLDLMHTLVRHYLFMLPTVSAFAWVPKYIFSLPSQERAQVYTQLLLQLDTTTSSKFGLSTHLLAAQTSGLDVVAIGTLITDELILLHETSDPRFRLSLSLLQRRAYSIVETLEQLHSMYPDQCSLKSVIQKLNRICRLLLELDDIDSVHDITTRFTPPPGLIVKHRTEDNFYWWEYLDYRTYCEVSKLKSHSESSKKDVTKFLEAGLQILECGDWLIFFSENTENNSTWKLDRITSLRQQLIRKLLFSILHRISLHDGFGKYGTRLLKAIVRYPAQILDGGMTQEEISRLSLSLAQLPYSSFFGVSKPSHVIQSRLLRMK